jgi:ubiquinone/menaquinone biosynthesis C-methylase UbiE
MNKSHRDFLSVIGETTATGRFRIEKDWNSYYLSHYKSSTRRMLAGERRDNILDVGTSYGVWFRILKRQGFADIYGVELDKGRAKIAQSKGYKQLVNCDAASVPFDSDFFHNAISNDVFVHIIKESDRIEVLNEIYRVLKPGGSFILNFAIGKNISLINGERKEYCKFDTLDSAIQLIQTHTHFIIEDFAPSIYTFTKFNRLIYPVRMLLVKFLPIFGRRICFLLDLAQRLWHVELESSNYLYVKLRKEV